MAQIAASQCTNLSTAPGFYLRDDAARAWDRAVAAFGKTVLLTGAWRSYETQERIFRERYRAGARSPFGDYRRWQGQVWGRVTGAAAAVPGTSNHGGGVAVDVKTSRSKGDPAYPAAVVFTSFNDPDRLAFLKVAAAHGWYDTEGRSVNEPWHLTYYPERDKHRGEKAKATKPARSGPLTVKEKVQRVQSAVHAAKDGVWGPDTDKRVAALRISSRFGGGRFPFTVKFTQGVVGAKVDGVWGPASAARHTATVRRIQEVLGLPADGVYGPATHAALNDLKRQAKKA